MRSIQRVQKEAWVDVGGVREGRPGVGVGGVGSLLLLLLIPKYGQQTTGGKSAAFTFSPRPRR